MSARFNAAERESRAAIRDALTAATIGVETLAHSWNGSSEHLKQADAVVAHVEAALLVARQHAALVHASAADHHGEAARPDLDRAMRRWVA